MLASAAIGCGGKSGGSEGGASDLPTPPGGVVAHVGPYTIDTQAFKAAFARVVDAEPAATRVTAVPPDFGSCIDRLEGIARKLKLRTPSRAQLKGKCSERYAQTRDAALMELIQGLWIVGEAKALGLSVNPGAIRDHWSGLRAESRRLAKLMGQRISEPVERLSRAQLRSYYEDHHEVFAIPHRRDIRIVRVASEPAARRVKREIEMGRTFASAAKGLPRQPTKNGFVTGFEKGAYREPVLSEALITAKPHRLEGPLFVAQLGGYFIFEVVRDSPRHQRPFASVERKVVGELPGKLQQQRIAAFRRAWVAKWKAATACAAGYVVTLCRQVRVTMAPAELESVGTFQ